MLLDKRKLTKQNVLLYGILQSPLAEDFVVL